MDTQVKDIDVVLIFLYDKDLRFLLQHRTNDARLLPGYWAFFGGSKEAEETLTDALYREAFEELNYKLKSPKKVLVQDFQEGIVRGTLHCFVDFISEADKDELVLQEGQGWGWFNVQETARLLMTDRDRGILAKLTSIIKNEQGIDTI